ncbi:hypothetical protein JOB18_014239 [Solea senegalensis]|uniref:Uncharacterized protein n=1 Tax=Solea senegalensis TaxID=28829 RepID=A0AAV6T5N3_SOLSE|nr:hypothetical protein JOB18_014239 [Solea senegalensis]
MEDEYPLRHETLQQHLIEQRQETKAHSQLLVDHHPREQAAETAQRETAKAGPEPAEVFRSSDRALYSKARRTTVGRSKTTWTTAGRCGRVSSRTSFGTVEGEASLAEQQNHYFAWIEVEPPEDAGLHPQPITTSSISIVMVVKHENRLTHVMYTFTRLVFEKEMKCRLPLEEVQVQHQLELMYVVAEEDSVTRIDFSSRSDTDVDSGIKPLPGGRTET